ncbi:MAG: outer membrane lipoprotein-sorting protein, partial [Candidatus Zixiibacteriota bacterium]
VEDPVDSLIYIDCIPCEDLPIVWGNIIIAVTRISHLPVWQKFYDEKGKLMRVMTYSEVREFSGRKIPAVMAMEPQDKEGHRTEIRYTRIDFNIKVDEEIFSLRNLRSLP